MSKQKLTTISLAILALWSGSLYYVFATPPSSPYTVAENITDPSCAPNALNCYVSVVTADNGLTATGANVQLGGTLLQNTIINQNGNDLNITNGNFRLENDSDLLGFGVSGIGLTYSDGTEQSLIGMVDDPAGRFPALYYYNSGAGYTLERTISTGDTGIEIANTETLAGTIFRSSAGFGGSSNQLSVSNEALNELVDIDMTVNNTAAANGIRLSHENVTTTGNAYFVNINSETGVTFDSYVGNSYTFPLSDGSTNQVLSTNGSGQLSWTTVSGGGSLPTQTGHAGEYLTTDGTNPSWTTIAGGGLTSIGTINSQTRSANGATIAGNSLVLQTGNGILPGLLVGETTSTNTKLGVSSGLGITSSTGNVFVGLNAGENAANVTDEVYVGHWAGWNAANSWNNNAIGRGAGGGINHVIAANLFGNQAGQNATYSGAANFFGNGTGDSADYAPFSTFIGSMAGANTYGAAHSIFIGTSAGFGDNLTNYLSSDNSVPPISYVDTSILIGHKTSTGNFKNSIAVGAYATNTAENQFMIGSAVRTIDETIWKGVGGTTCTLTTGTGMACSSDERLKTNITDLSTTTLDNLLKVKTVTYTWTQNPTSKTQIGFLAQDLEQYFPELVATDKEGMKSVYYAQMTPILVEAIRELNVKVGLLSPGGPSTTVFDGIKAWLGDAQNGITEVIADTLRARNQICIDDVCMSKEQLRVILQNNTTITSTPPADPVMTTVTDVPAPDTINSSDATDIPPIASQN